jgi:hypothetical protein
MFALLVFIGTLSVCSAEPNPDGWYTPQQAATGAKA